MSVILFIFLYPVTVQNKFGLLWGSAHHRLYSQFPKFQGIIDLRLQQHHISNNISRIAVMAPPFWKTNPRLWFNQLQSELLPKSVLLKTMSLTQ
ncbi:hypothetical protein GQX74_010126 [Glossina fuscipes]|nr:hypothetical protein GQX74_010126 [Glossina fuscipes]